MVGVVLAWSSAAEGGMALLPIQLKARLFLF